MTSTILIALIMRWLHVLAAVTAVGGSIFLRVVLMPAAATTLPDDAHQQLRVAVTRRWQRLVHMCILFFLVSGSYNYLTITRFDHVNQPLYHALFGIKFLLALVIFVLAILLTSLKPWSAKVRARAGVWLGLLVVLALATVLISSGLKVMPKSTAASVANGTNIHVAP